MKIKSLFLTCLFYAFNFTAQNWQPLNSGSSKDLYAISFPDPQNGFVAGDGGTLLKTTNAGLNWSAVFSDTTPNFISLHFPSSVNGYALTNHKLYRTLNNGNTWQNIYTDTLNALHVVYFIDNLTGFIGKDSSIYKTSDAGLTWSFVKNTSSRINTIFFPSPSVGYFAGGADQNGQIYKTINQGNSFTNYALDLQSIKEQVFFLNDTVGYITGWYSGALSVTKDGGKTWTVVNQQNDTQGWDVCFLNESTGYYINNSGGTSKIFKTVDAGNSWLEDAGGTSFTFRKFAFPAGGKAYAIGKNGGIYSSQVSTMISESKNENGIKIYPNPSFGKFKIKSDQEVEFHILNELGQKVQYLQVVTVGSFEYEISGLAKGIYFLRMTGKSGSLDQKIIVQ